MKARNGEMHQAQEADNQNNLKMQSTKQKPKWEPRHWKSVTWLTSELTQQHNINCNTFRIKNLYFPDFSPVTGIKHLSYHYYSFSDTVSTDPRNLSGETVFIPCSVDQPCHSCNCSVKFLTLATFCGIMVTYG